MALLCLKCGGIIPDLGGHNCNNLSYVRPYRPQPRTIINGCSLCGSTAIDHTEAECLRNRQLKPVLPPHKVKKVETDETDQ